MKHLKNIIPNENLNPEVKIADLENFFNTLNET